MRVINLLPVSVKAKLGTLDLWLILPFVLYIGNLVVQIVFAVLANWINLTFLFPALTSQLILN